MSTVKLFLCTLLCTLCETLLYIVGLILAKHLIFALNLKVTVLFNLRVEVDGRLYDAVTDLFGTYSPVARMTRNLMFWNPRMLQHCQFPTSELQVEQMHPLEIAFRGLRQMTSKKKCSY